ncbi:MAG: PQQ-binding-like beta-propeller repeat protein, partial [Pirellulales bacterium]
PKPDHSPTRIRYPWVTWYTLPISAAGDSLFFNSAIAGRTVCLDAASGEKRWEFTAGAAINRTPTFWQGKIYVGSDDGHAYCLDAKTGAVVWKFNAAPANRWMFSYGKPVSSWPVRTDVSVENGVAYFGAGVFPHDGTFMYAVNANTGELIWRNGVQCETGDRVSMSPAGHLFVLRDSIWVPKDCWGYFTGWWTLVSFDRKTGGPLSTHPGKDEWPEFPNLEGPFWPLYGVKKDNIRYTGTQATQIDQDDPKKQTQLWREDLPGRWVDIDSVLSVRDRRAPIVYRYDPDLSSVVYAGGILYHTAFDVDVNKGTGSGIYARDPKDGKLLWSTDVPERANQLIVANGRLFVTTRTGVIYCFGPTGTQKHGVIDEAVETATLAGADGIDYGATAEKIVNAAASQNEPATLDGYAVVLDCDSGGLALELAKRTKLNLVAIFHNAEKAAAARAVYTRANLHVGRIIAFHQPPDSKLPFPSYFADLIVSEAAADGGDLPQNFEQVARMLKPIRGVGLIGGKQTQEALDDWKPNGWKVVGDDAVRWAKHVRPPLKNAGSWSQPYADAGHTNCSNDGVLKPPLGVVWYGGPHLEAGSGAPAGLSLVSDGVFFLYRGGDLVAHDQYTGRELWRREKSRTDMAAAPGNLFLRFLEEIVLLDPYTGKERARYLPPFDGGQWNMMAPDREGKTLFLAAGSAQSDEKNAKKWSCVLALDVRSGKPRWILGGPNAEKQWGGWNAIGDGYLYGWGGVAEAATKDQIIAEMREYLAANDPVELEKFNKEVDQHTFSTITAVDAKTGKVLYTHGVDLTNCGGAWLPQVGFGGGRNARHYNPFVIGCTMAQKDVIIFCTASGADKGWRVWPSGGYQNRSIAVHDGKTGKLLWKKACNHRTRPVVVDETIHAEPWAYDLRTGEKKTRIHPITGKQSDWAWCRAGKQCGQFSASTHFLFGRSTGVGYQDLLTDQGLYTFFHSRMSCSFDSISGGGLMIKPPHAVYCRCSWSLPFTVALGQVPSSPSVGQLFAQPGSTLPVKHLFIDFAGTGDRRDSDGNLWLKPERPLNHALVLGHEMKLEKYEGASDVRRNSRYTRIDNTDTPFVFATAIQGLKSCVVPVTSAEHGKGRYRVRLGFAALPDDQLGQRVFHVKLNGKTVLPDFDILSEAGKTERAVWMEFVEEIDGELVLELVSKSGTPTPKQMPLISGLQIVRDGS